MELEVQRRGEEGDELRTERRPGGAEAERLEKQDDEEGEDGPEGDEEGEEGAGTREEEQQLKRLGFRGLFVVFSGFIDDCCDFGV